MFASRLFLTAVILSAAASAVRADTIHFEHGTKIECRIKADETNEKQVTFYLDGNEERKITLEMKNIKAIVLDYNSQLQALKDDDWAGHYKLGCFCQEMIADDPAMRAKAIERFLYCRGREGVPNDVYRRLGKLYSEQTPADDANTAAALENYKKYLELNPAADDAAEIKAEIARLENMLPKEQAAPPAEEKNILEGLEIQNWQNESWSNSGRTRLVNDKANGGNQMLEVAVTPGDKDKAAFTMRLNRDLSGYDYMTFDAYNPESFPVTVWAAMTAGPKSIWYEQLRTITIPPESWATGLQIDFRQKNWKGFDGGRQIGNGIVPELKPVRNLLFIFGNSKRPFKVYLDSIMFQKRSTVKAE